jgi:hypothetical protein
MALRGALSEWRDRADYQEKSSGAYLGNALAAEWLSAQESHQVRHASPGELDGIREGAGFVTAAGLLREAADPDSGVDSAAAWAVRPFPQPALFAAARRSLLALISAQGTRFGASATRFGIVPSEDWPEADPWTAPTAWSAWSFAALARLGPADSAVTSFDGTGSASARDRRWALRLLAALRRAATPAGLLAERVDARSGVPRSTAPLGWSHAFALLALRELWPPRPIRVR